jgi:Inner membrane component of T3SS, cytoplasmic domain
MYPFQQKQSASENEGESSILGQLETYGSLVSECARYALLEKNAEQNRHTVRPHIFAKVRNEYADRKGALEQEQERQRIVLLGKLETSLEKRKQLNEECRQVADSLEELDFRLRVGEFEEEQIKETRRELKEDLLQVTKALADAQEVVTKFEQVGLLAQVPPRIEKAVSDEWDETSQDRRDFLILEESPTEVDEGSPVVHYPQALITRPPREGTGKAAAAPETGEEALPADSVAGYLVALDGTRRGERFPLISSEITVGSSPGIDIRLPDSGIARLHARIVYRNRRHYLETVEESGSCFVNGVRTNKAELKDGDVLSLGKVKMQVEYAREANA